MQSEYSITNFAPANTQAIESQRVVSDIRNHGLSEYTTLNSAIARSNGKRIWSVPKATNSPKKKFIVGSAALMYRRLSNMRKPEAYEVLVTSTGEEGVMIENPSMLYIDFEFKPKAIIYNSANELTEWGSRVYSAWKVHLDNDDMASIATQVLSDNPYMMSERNAEETLILLLEMITTFITLSLTRGGDISQHEWIVETGCKSINGDDKMSFHIANSSICFDYHCTSLAFFIREFNNWAVSVSKPYLKDILSKDLLTQQDKDIVCSRFYILGLVDTKPATRGPCDTAVYSRNQSFRLAGCGKAGDDVFRPLRPVRIHDGVVSCEGGLIQTCEITRRFDALIRSKDQLTNGLKTQREEARDPIHLSPGNLYMSATQLYRRTGVCGFRHDFVRAPAVNNTSIRRAPMIRRSCGNDGDVSTTTDVEVISKTVCVSDTELDVTNEFGAVISAQLLVGGELVYHNFHHIDVDPCESGDGSPNMTTYADGDTGEISLYCFKCTMRFVLKRIWVSNPIRFPSIVLPVKHTEAIRDYIRDQRLEQHETVDSSGRPDYNASWPIVRCRIVEDSSMGRFCVDHPMGHRFINQYCNSEFDIGRGESINKFHAINVLTSGGKTSYMMRYIAVERDIGTRGMSNCGFAMTVGKRYLVTYHRRALCLSAKRRFESLDGVVVAHYSETAPQLYDNLIHNGTHMEKPLVVVCTVDSMPGLKNGFFDVWFLDEAGAQRHQTVADTIMPRINDVLASMTHQINQSKTVVMLEHDLQEEVVDYFLAKDGVSMSDPSVHTLFVDIKVKPPPIESSSDLPLILFHLFERIRDPENYTSDNRLKSPIFIVATRAQFLIGIQKYIQSMYKGDKARVLAIVSATMRKRDVRSFVSNPNDRAVYSKFDVVLVTHCVNASLSVEHWFTKCYWFLHSGLLTSRDEWQLIQRLRYSHLDVFEGVHAYIEPDQISAISQTTEQLNRKYFSAASVSGIGTTTFHRNSSQLEVLTDLTSEKSTARVMHRTFWKKLYQTSEDSSFTEIEATEEDAPYIKGEYGRFSEFLKAKGYDANIFLGRADAHALTTCMSMSDTQTHMEQDLFTSASEFVSAVLVKILHTNNPIEASAVLETFDERAVVFRRVAKAIAMLRLVSLRNPSSILTAQTFTNTMKPAYRTLHFLEHIRYHILAGPNEDALDDSVPYVRRIRSSRGDSILGHAKTLFVVAVVEELFRLYGEERGVDGNSIKGTFTKPTSWVFCFKKSSPGNSASLTATKVMVAVRNICTSQALLNCFSDIFGTKKSPIDFLADGMLKERKRKPDAKQRNKINPSKLLNILFRHIGFTVSDDISLDTKRGVTHYTINQSLVRNMILLWLVLSESRLGGTRGTDEEPVLLPVIGDMVKNIDTFLSRELMYIDPVLKANDRVPRDGLTWAEDGRDVRRKTYNAWQVTREQLFTAGTTAMFADGNVDLNISGVTLECAMSIKRFLDTTEDIVSMDDFYRAIRSPECNKLVMGDVEHMESVRTEDTTERNSVYNRIVQPLVNLKVGSAPEPTYAELNTTVPNDDEPINNECAQDEQASHTAGDTAIPSTTSNGEASTADESIQNGQLSPTDDNTDPPTYDSVSTNHSDTGIELSIDDAIDIRDSSLNRWLSDPTVQENVIGIRIDSFTISNGRIVMDTYAVHRPQE